MADFPPTYPPHPQPARPPPQQRPQTSSEEGRKMNRAANDQLILTVTEKAPTWAFSWLKVPTSAFTFKTLLAWCFIVSRPF